MPKVTISSQAEKFLISQDWRGNVRELENVIHRAMLLSDKYILDVKDFTHAIEEINQPADNTPQKPYTISMLNVTGKLKTADIIEQEAIKIAMEHHKNNITQAAKSLGMAKSTFYKRLKNNDN